MQTIRSILKRSVEQLGLVENLTLSYTFLSLAFAVFCALVIYAVYRIFYRGAVYSENFAVLLVMMTVVTAFIILTISSNLVLSLGMVGALSIVRFRSAVKDPLDVGFMFWAIAAGITCGAGLYPIAVCATLAIALVYAAFCLLGRSAGAYVLVVRYKDEAGKALDDLMAANKAKLRGRASYHGEYELTVNVRCKKGEAALLDQILAVEGVVHAVLVECTGD